MKLFVKHGVSKSFPEGVRCALTLGLSLMLCVSAVAVAQIPAGDADAVSHADAPLSIKTTAELVKTTITNGKVRIELTLADRLVGGDEVIYTLEVRNGGTVGVDHYAFTSPIPQHMRYVPNSAVAPGAEIRYSVDGGQSFDTPENLTVHGADGKERPAAAEDYTHIRWVLRNRLKAGSMTLARFRAVVIS